MAHNRHLAAHSWWLQHAWRRALFLYGASDATPCPPFEPGFPPLSPPPSCLPPWRSPPRLFLEATPISPGWLFGLQLGHRTKALVESKSAWGGGGGLPLPVPAVCLHRFQLRSSSGDPRMTCSLPILQLLGSSNSPDEGTDASPSLQHTLCAAARQCPLQIALTRTSTCSSDRCFLPPLSF